MATEKAPEDIAWTTEKDETPDRMVFDTPGDVYVGYFTGMVTITPEEDEPFEQVQWRDYAAPHAPKCTNAGYQLVQAYKNVPIGALTRTTLLKTVDVKQASPMKDFRVEVAQNEPGYADIIKV